MRVALDAGAPAGFSFSIPQRLWAHPLSHSRLRLGFHFVRRHIAVALRTSNRHTSPRASEDAAATVRRWPGQAASLLGKVDRARREDGAEQSVKPCCSTAARWPIASPISDFRDDVKCAHGASVGELDADQLFYAMSRGLDPATARALLLEGFVMGLWDDVPDGDAIRDASRAALRAIA